MLVFFIILFLVLGSGGGGGFDGGTDVLFQHFAVIYTSTCIFKCLKSSFLVFVVRSRY